MSSIVLDEERSELESLLKATAQQRLAPLRSQDELFALLQEWVNDADSLNLGIVTPAEFCEAVHEILQYVPVKGLLDQIEESVTHNVIMSWANGLGNGDMSRIPWNEVHTGLQELRAARGWPPREG